MLKRLRQRVGLIVCLFAMANIAMANEAVVDDVLRLSGFNQAFDQLPKIMDQQLNEMPPMLSAEEQKSLKAAMQSSFQPEQLNSVIRQVFIDNYQAEPMLALQQKLDTPLARKMVEAEAELNTLAGYQALEAFAQQLKANPPTLQRARLVKKLTTQMQVDKTALNMMVGMMRGMFVGINTFAPMGMTLPPAQIDNMITMTKAQYLPQLQSQIRAGLLFAYRDVDQQQLEAYSTMLEAPEFAWFAGVQEKAMTAAFTQAGENVGMKLAHPTPDGV